MTNEEMLVLAREAWKHRPNGERDVEIVATNLAGHGYAKIADAAGVSKSLIGTICRRFDRLIRRRLEGQSHVHCAQIGRPGSTYETDERNVRSDPIAEREVP